MKVQYELKAPKSQFNDFGKYKYRSCEDILEAVKPLLHKHSCVITLSDSIQNVGDRYYISATATFIDAETGEKIEVVSSARESENKKGMDESQITGTASSYARKYALNGLLCIDDTKDADATNTHENIIDKTNKKEKSALTDAQIKRAYAIATSVNKSTDDVKKYIKKKWGKESLKDLTKKEYEELCKALESAKPKEA